MSTTLLLDKRQVVVDDLPKLRTRRGILACAVSQDHIILYAYKRHVPSGKTRLNKAITSAFDYITTVSNNPLAQRGKSQSPACLAHSRLGA